MNLEVQKQEDDENDCIKEITTKEQFRFILQHILEDLPEAVQIPKKELTKFLKGTSKYWARIPELTQGGNCGYFLELADYVKKNRDILDENSIFLDQMIEIFNLCFLNNRGERKTATELTRIQMYVELTFKIPGLAVEKTPPRQVNPVNSHP